MYGYPATQTPSMSTPAYGQESVNDMALFSNEPSSFSSGSKDDGMRDKPRPSAVVIGVMITLGAIVMAVTVIVLSSGSTSNDETGGTEEHPEITKKNMKDPSSLTVIVPEFRAISTPPPFTKKSTTEANTGDATETPFTVSEITDVRTMPITTESPPASKKDTWVGLLCTIGTKLRAPEMLPSDIMCSYLFYDSLFKKGPTSFDPGHLDPALRIFLGNRSEYENTMLGIGFAFKYRQHLKSQLSTKGGATPVVVKHFLDQDICNFGILDTPTKGLDESSMGDTLESLKLVDRFLISQRTRKRNCLTVLAVPTPDANMENIYVEKFSKIFTPGIVVMLSHYLDGDNTFEDCRVVPPAMLTRPLPLTTSRSYKYDLSTAADSIRKLIERGVDASWALSVTLKGRWTKLKAGQPADFLSECVYDPSAESFGSYTEVCENSSFTADIQYKSSIYGRLYYNQNDGRMFSFDNTATYIEKLCRVRAQQFSFAMGLAAYDVDYDDFSDVCDSINYYGKFNRLFNFRDLMFYIGRRFNASEQLQGCLILVVE